MKDLLYMKKAIEISKLGEFSTAPNPIVGCLIVNNDNIVGQGWHEKYGENHAEINALKMAGHQAKGATAYITLEPCNHFGKTPPCCKEIIKSGIKRVVISNVDPNPIVSGRGVSYLRKNGIIVTIGVMSKESRNCNKGFFKRMQTGFP